MILVSLPEILGEDFDKGKEEWRRKKFDWLKFFLRAGSIEIHYNMFQQGRHSPKLLRKNYDRN